MGTADQPYNPPYSLTQFQQGVSAQGIPIMGLQSVAGPWITLTSAQLRALQTTAVTLVPNPTSNITQIDGSINLVLIPKRMTLDFIFVTTQYTLGNANNAFQLEYIGKTTALATAAAAGLVDQPNSGVISVGPTAAGALSLGNCLNLGFELKLVGTTPALTLGDGALRVQLEFSAMPVVPSGGSVS